MLPDTYRRLCTGTTPLIHIGLLCDSSISSTTHSQRHGRTFAWHQYAQAVRHVHASAWRAAGVTSEDALVAMLGCMRDAADAVDGILAGLISTDGEADPAIIVMRTVLAEVESIDTHNLDAQRAATLQFRERHEYLTSGLALAADAERNASLGGHEYATPEFLADQRSWVTGLNAIQEFRRRNARRHKNGDSGDGRF